MPSSLQYPLERHRDLQRRWQHLLQQTVTPTPARVGALNGSNAIVSPVATSPVAYVAGNTMTPRGSRRSRVCITRGGGYG